MFAKKGSGFNHFRRALVASSVVRRESACLTFSSAHHRQHQSHAVMSSNTCNAFFSRSYHRHRENEQSPFKRIRPCSRYITSSVLAGKSKNTGEASVSATRSPSIQKFLDSICQSFGADILPEVLKGITESDGPTMESPLVVVLAVSGGCDSVALLHAMKQLAYEIPDSTKGERILRTAEPTQDEGPPTNGTPCEIHVVHFDHQQRGEESDGDRKFVEKLASEAGFVFHSFRWGDDDRLIERSVSQDAARNWRRTNLIQLADSLAKKKRGIRMAPSTARASLADAVRVPPCKVNQIKCSASLPSQRASSHEPPPRQPNALARGPIESENLVCSTSSATASPADPCSTSYLATMSSAPAAPRHRSMVREHSPHDDVQMREAARIQVVKATTEHVNAPRRRSGLR